MVLVGEDCFNGNRGEARGNQADTWRIHNSEPTAHLETIGTVLHYCYFLFSIENLSSCCKSQLRYPHNRYQKLKSARHKVKPKISSRTYLAILLWPLVYSGQYAISAVQNAFSVGYSQGKMDNFSTTWEDLLLFAKISNPALYALSCSLMKKCLVASLAMPRMRSNNQNTRIWDLKTVIGVHYHILLIERCRWRRRRHSLPLPPFGGNL